jgi:hypothetical protein
MTEVSELFGSLRVSDEPAWYLIPEIRFSDYVRCVQGLYEVLEMKNAPRGEDDVFMKSIIQARTGISDAHWAGMELNRRMEKALTMKMGDFHEELAGKFPGYQTLKNGHGTECDVMKKDGTEIWEWKNRDNTMNHKAAKQTVEVLKKNHAAGMKPFLVFVNCTKNKPPRFGAPECVTVLTGKEAYAYLSNRESFFEDLNKTLAATFAAYRTFSELNALIAPGKI